MNLTNNSTIICRILIYFIYFLLFFSLGEDNGKRKTRQKLQGCHNRNGGGGGSQGRGGHGGGRGRGCGKKVNGLIYLIIIRSR